MSTSMLSPALLLPPRLPCSEEGESCSLGARVAMGGSILSALEDDIDEPRGRGWGGRFGTFPEPDDGSS